MFVAKLTIPYYDTVYLKHNDRLIPRNALSYDNVENRLNKTRLMRL